jgi:hypothetical protein
MKSKPLKNFIFDYLCHKIYHTLNSVNLFLQKRNLSYNHIISFVQTHINISGGYLMCKKNQAECRVTGLQSVETGEMNRRTLIGVSAKTLGAIYLAPATVTLLTSKQAGAQSNPAPVCQNCGNQHFNSSPSEPGWVLTYTDCNLTVHTQEPIPPQNPAGPDIPLDYPICCGTTVRLQSCATCSPPNYDQSIIACGSPFAPNTPPWQ